MSRANSVSRSSAVPCRPGSRTRVPSRSAADGRSRARRPDRLGKAFLVASASSSASTSDGLSNSVASVTRSASGPDAPAAGEPSRLVCSKPQRHADLIGQQQVEGLAGARGDGLRDDLDAAVGVDTPPSRRAEYRITVEPEAGRVRQEVPDRRSRAGPGSSRSTRPRCTLSSVTSEVSSLVTEAHANGRSTGPRDATRPAADTTPTAAVPTGQDADLIQRARRHLLPPLRSAAAPFGAGHAYERHPGPSWHGSRLTGRT